MKEERAVTKGLERQLSSVMEDEEDEEADGKVTKRQRKKKQTVDSETSESESEEDEQMKQKKKKEKMSTQEEFKKLSSELRVPLFEEYYFPCKQWFAEDEGDGLTVRELTVDRKEMFFKE